MVSGVLALVALALTLWASHLERRLRELSSPEVNVPIFDLQGPIATRSETSEARQRLEVPPTSRFYTLVLPVPGSLLTPEQETDESYQVEIRRADGSLAWRGEGLEPNPWGSVTLMLPSHTLAAGDYQLKLTARAPADPRLAADFHFTLARAAESPPKP